MLDSFGGEYGSSQRKMDWKCLRVLYALDSLHHLLPVKGVLVCVYIHEPCEFKWLPIERQVKFSHIWLLFFAQYFTVHIHTIYYVFYLNCYDLYFAFLDFQYLAVTHNFQTLT